MERNTLLCAGAVGALLVFTLFFSSYQLTESPPTWFDEGLYIQVAQSLAQDGSQTIQIAPDTQVSTGFITGGYPFLAPVAVSLLLFGNDLVAARLPMVLFIVSFVLAAFMLIWRVAGFNNALLALLLLSTFPLLYGNGKNVLGEVPGMLYTLAALYFLWRIEKQNFIGVWSYVLLGLMVGLAVATKPIFLLLPLALVLVLLWRVRQIPFHWREILAGFAAFLVPVALWAYFQFGSGDSLGGVLTHYANPYAVGSLFDTVMKNLARFFTEATPLYCAVLMAAWLASLAVRKRRGTPVTLAEAAAFTFSILILLAYLRTAGWYRYFFEAMLLALIFLPAALRSIAPKYVLWGAVALLTCVHLYELTISSWVAESYRSTTSAELKEYFAVQPQETSYFIYNVPDVVPFLQTKNYYQYVESTPATTLGSEYFERISQGDIDQVIIGRAAYVSHEDLFKRYSEGGTAGSYLVLKKK